MSPLTAKLKCPWGWITDSRNLRCAWRTTATNKSRRTPGIDGVTAKLRWCGGLVALWSLESRVRNEKRMLSPERGYGRPVVERPYGARSLPYYPFFIMHCRWRLKSKRPRPFSGWARVSRENQRSNLPTTASSPVMPNDPKQVSFVGSAGAPQPLQARSPL